MLRAIRELAGDAPIKVQRQDAAERRHMTVMFCDLVGSTALTAQLDPEDMGDLLRAFQAAVATPCALRRPCRQMARGTARSVYFGYPARP